jgi:hypothetical protein
MEKKQERVEQDTNVARSYGNTLQLKTGNIWTPVDYFYDIGVNFSMFGLLCHVLLGSACDLARMVHSIYNPLKHPSIMVVKHKVTLLFFRQITSAIHDD